MVQKFGGTYVEYETEITTTQLGHITELKRIEAELREYVKEPNVFKATATEELLKRDEGKLPLNDYIKE